MGRITSLCTAVTACLAFEGAARADGVVVHAGADVAHAVGAPQGSELGTGGGGSATVELAMARGVGVQAGAGALVLPRGDAPTDPTLAPRSTATAVFGAAGLRVHPFGGLWIDANAGLAQTGSLLRPALGANLGWDFRVSERSLWELGPFVGYMQIVQPESTLRPDDARIALAGLQVSLGRAPAAPPPPAPAEPSPLAAEPEPARDEDVDHDGFALAIDACPAGKVEVDEEGCVARVELQGDRIVLGDVIHFDLDSPHIQDVSHELVRRVAALIEQHPEIVEVDIEGHADARGTDAYNQALSVARAESTRNLLVAYGVDLARLRPIGHGKRKLRVQTPLAEVANRRVEFVVVTRKQESARHASSAAGPKGQP